MKINNRYLIETDSGYRDFLGVKESIQNGIVIEHECGIINCTKKHLILVNKTKNIFVEAQNLNEGDYIESSKIISITKEFIC